MNIQICKLKTYPRLSEETLAFDCDVWVDGNKAGMAQNRGCGGNTDVTPYALQKQLDTYAQTLPPKVYHYKEEAFETPMRADTLIDELVFTEVATRELERKLRASFLVRKAGSTDIYQLSKKKFTDWPIVQVRQELTTRYADVLNFMPFEAALAVWRME